MRTALQFIAVLVILLVSTIGALFVAENLILAGFNVLGVVHFFGILVGGTYLAAWLIAKRKI